jgi:hypothetical protein
MTGTAELPSSEDICALVGEVWSSFLGEDSLPVRLQSLPAATAGPVDDEVRSTVGITGAWNGELTLITTSAAVAVVARAVFGDPSVQLAHAELADVVGELGNIIAGNIKSVLAGPSALLLPSVVFGALPGEQATDRRADTVMSWDEHPVIVSLNTRHPMTEDDA